MRTERYETGPDEAPAIKFGALMSEQGTTVGFMLGEDEIVYGVRE